MVWTRGLVGRPALPPWRVGPNTRSRAPLNCASRGCAMRPQAVGGICGPGGRLEAARLGGTPWWPRSVRSPSGSRGRIRTGLGGRSVEARRGGRAAPLLAAPCGCRRQLGQAVASWGHVLAVSSMPHHAGHRGQGWRACRTNGPRSGPCRPLRPVASWEHGSIVLACMPHQ